MSHLTNPMADQTFIEPSVKPLDFQFYTIDSIQLQMMLNFFPKETNSTKTCREKESNSEYHLKLQRTHPLFFLNCMRTKWLKETTKTQLRNKIAALRIHKPIHANKKLDISHEADNHSN
jgi:hypothetical protein